ncbi:MAG: 3-isopropylmalate dehydratase small subunit [Myxococcales bacterium]|nr:3-isopropylmalate dehydratase small subunit [Myxococcales bacterium]MCB9519497.1 3-isopropylmalate dehydratase small subunit [Myxococcales bacterium]MCB9532097.1 3-isopropylmalate dehydratase small subunit [Myxococcales bacterium]MCB9533278.1 3-isopropylmalate dehydratase small subunit [Myxococcales bacterium]
MSAGVSQVSGACVPIPGDDIDTDRIVPARFLRCVTFDALGDALFRDDRDRSGDTPHPLDDARYSEATIIVSGRNFGCGSSREHAPQAVVRAGFRAIIAESFAEIFAANSLAIGLVCAEVDASTREELFRRIAADPAIRVELDLAACRVRADGFEAPVRLPDAARIALLDGSFDPLTELLANHDAVARVAHALPYLAWTSR